MKQSSLKKRLQNILVFGLIFTLLFSSYVPVLASSNPKKNVNLFNNVFSQLTEEAMKSNVTTSSINSYWNTTTPFSRGLQPFVYAKPMVTEDGRYLFYFQEYYVDGDPYNIQFHLYRYDRLYGDVQLIDADENWEPVNEGIGNFAITPDGTKVVFSSKASNLVQNDTNNAMDIFIAEIRSEDPSDPNDDPYYMDVTIEGITVNAAIQGDADSVFATISADGQYVVFSSKATNLLPGDNQSNGEPQIYLYEVATGAIERISNSVDSPGQAANGASYHPAISADNSYIVYDSSANDLVANDTNNASDIFLYEIATGVTNRINTAMNGEEANADSFAPIFSADGNQIAFHSLASNLGDGIAAGNHPNVFLYHRLSGDLEQVTVGYDGNETDGYSNIGAFSSDGKYLSILSDANNLVPDDPFDSSREFQRQTDAFVYDLSAKSFIRLTSLLEDPTGTFTTYATFANQGKSVLFLASKNGEADHAIPSENSIYAAYNINDLPTWNGDETITFAKNDYEVTITWDAANDPRGNLMGYQVFVSDSFWTYVDADLQTARIYINEGYDTPIRVEAVSTSFDTTNNGPSIVIPADDDIIPPTWPENAQVYIDQATDTSATLSWDGAEDNGTSISYRIYRESDTTTALAIVNTNSATLENLDPATAYSLLIYAYDGAGNRSEDALPVFFNTNTPRPEWPMGANIDIINVGSNSVSLEWDAATISSGSISYEIYQSSDSVRQLLKKVDTPSATINNLTPETDYFFMIYAVSDLGIFSYDGLSVFFTTVEDTVDPIAFSTRTDARKAMLTWEPPTGVTVVRYEVTQQLEGGLKDVLDSNLPASQRTYEVDRLIPGGTYTYQVIGYDSADAIVARSTTETVTIDDISLSNLSTQVVDKNKVQLTWDAPAEEMYVMLLEVWRMEAEGDPVLLTSLPPSSTSYQDTNLKLGTYNYFVRGYDTETLVYETNPAEAQIIDYPIGELVVGYHRITDYWTYGVQYLIPDQPLAISISGPSGSDVTATITYTMIENPESPETIVQKQDIVAMTETEEGYSYSGTYTIPQGLSEIKGIHVTFDKPNGESETIASQDIPIYAAALLKVTIAAEGSIVNELTDGLLNFINSSVYHTGTIDGPGEYSVYLPATDPYTIRLLSKNYQNLAEKANIQLTPGLTKEVSITLNQGANLNMKVVDDQGNPIPYITLYLQSETGTYLGYVTTGENGLTNTIVNLAIGQKVTAQLTNLPTGYIINNRIQSTVLAKGDNQIVFELTSIPRVTLTGKVTDEDGNPLARIVVSVTQLYDGRYEYFYGETDPDGNYSIQLYQPTDSTRYTVSISDSNYVPITQTYLFEGEGDQVKNFSLEKKQYGEVKLDLYTRYATDNNWQGPMEIDWRVAVHFNLSIYPKRGGSMLASSSYPWKVIGKPGDLFTVCANGSEAGLPRACTDVTLDENGKATAELRLSEGPLVQGKLQLTNDIQFQSWNAIIYKQDEQQKWQYTVPIRGSLSGNKTDFSIVLQDEGRYKLDLVVNPYSTKAYRTSVEFDAQYGLNPLLIPVTDIGSFAGQLGNGISSLKSHVVPGRTATFYLEYKNHGENAQASQLLLPIPAGTELVSGSLAVNGTAANAVETGQGYVIDLGDIPKGASGKATYQLLVDAGYGEEQLKAEAKILYNTASGQKEETIGFVTLSTTAVTLNVPISTSTPTITVSGYALADREVKVYEGNQLLKIVKATPTGLWSGEIELPDLGTPHAHKLVAVVEEGDLVHRSKEMEVLYDADYPKIEKIDMQQIDGRRITFYPDQGVARFPYVFVPGTAFIFEITFNKPERVENVVVHIGDKSSSNATWKEGSGVYQVMLNTDSSVGDIRVTYDVKKAPINLNINPADVPTEEEYSKSLPVPLRNYEVNDADPLDYANGDYTGSVELYYNDLDITSTTTFTIEPSTYAPTAEEIANSEQTGNQIFQATYDYEVNANGDLVVNVSGYVPEELLHLPDQVLANKAKTVRVTNVGNMVKVAVTNVLAKEGAALVQSPIQQGLNVVGNDMALRGTSGIRDTFKRIENMVDGAKNCPDLLHEIDVRAQDAMAGEIVKAGVGLASVALGIAFPGVGFAVGSFVGGMVVGAIVDNAVNNRIAQTENKLKQSKCDDPDDDDNNDNGSPMATPVWIYDPSGYVYEGVTSNRLEGVTATVLYLDQNLNEWVVWDAEWFEQINPQITDPLGKYGWDVPAGKWKVEWVKEGYETAYSAELDVPPPHFDVNMGLVSYQPPAIIAAKAVRSSTDASWIEFETSKYIRVNSLTNASLQVLDGETPIPGNIVAVDAENGDDSAALAKRFRFTTEAPLQQGGTYTLNIANNAIISYAGIPMASNYTSALVVEALDETGPNPIIGETAGGGSLVTLTFNEPLDRRHALDVTNFALTGTNAEIVNISYGIVENEVILSLFGKITTEEAASVAMDAAAVADAAGNTSAVANIQINNRAPSANLRSLTFAEGSLSPSFTANTLEYTHSVGMDAAQLKVTATLEDANGELRINNVVYPSGVEVTLPFTESETIIAIQAKATDGTKKEYLIQVVRTNRQNDDNDPPPSNPVTGGNTGNNQEVSIDANTLSQNVSNNTVMVELQGEQQLVRFTPEAWAEIKEKGYTIAINYQGARVTFTSDIVTATNEAVVVDIEALTMDQKVATLQTQTLGSSAEAAFTPVSKAYSVSVRKVVNNTEVEQLLLNEAISIEIPLSSQVPNPLAGIYQIVDGAPTYLGFFTGTAARFTTKTPGTFVLLQYQLAFTDTQQHWAKDAIDLLVAHHVLKGMSTTAFSPEGTVTRAQLAEMITRLLRLDTENTNSTFSDIASDAWYAKSVAAVAKAQIIVGNNQQFRPEDPITREEIAVVIARILKLSQKSALPFTDQEQISPWAIDAIQSIYTLGIINGRGDQRFAPKEHATRAEVATMIYRIFNFMANQ